MSTSELKLNLHQLIDGVSDSSILEAVYTLLSKASAGSEDDWYESLSDKAKASIQQGIEDADNKRFVPYSEVKAKADKVLGRTV
ncbi:MAG: hypothetical protein V4638_09300 [Bacteroidota bacterium]